jgi:SLT domain-containing protein
MAINLPIISEWNPAGIDKAINDFKKLETNGQKASFAIKKAAVPAGLAVAALGAVAFDAVKAFAEDDAAAQKLATTLGNVTGASDKQIASVEDFITKTSQAAAVADDELRPALDSLVRGTGDITKAQDLLGLALDVSAGTGKDLGAVSDALSKAFNGNLGPLKKLDPALADLIKSGATTDEVFAAMSETFAGQADTAANTTQGKMKNLGIQMGELKESIGAAVAPLAEKLLPKFLAFSAWIQKNKTLVVVLGAIIGGLAAAIIAVNTAMTIWTATTKAFSAVQAAFNAVMALNPIFLIVAAVVAIIAVLVILQKEFGLFDGVIRVVGDAFAAVWAAIKTVFDWVKDNWQLLLVILTGPFGLALAFVITFKDQIIGFIKGVIDWVTNNWKLILAILTGPFGLAILAITTFKDQIINVFSIIYNGIKAAMGFVANVITAPFKAAFNAIAKLWNNTIGSLSFTVPSWVPGIGGKGFNVPDIPELKDGGIVTQATLAMIGEGNEPEAVIPLSKLGSMGFGGGGNTFNVTVTSADPNAVVAALQRYVRMSGPVPVTTRPL